MTIILEGHIHRPENITFMCVKIIPTSLPGLNYLDQLLVQYGVGNYFESCAGPPVAWLVGLSKTKSFPFCGHICAKNYVREDFPNIFIAYAILCPVRVRSLETKRLVSSTGFAVAITSVFCCLFLNRTRSLRVSGTYIGCRLPYSLSPVYCVHTKLLHRKRGIYVCRLNKTLRHKTIHI